MADIRKDSPVLVARVGWRDQDRRSHVQPGNRGRRFLSRMISGVYSKSTWRRNGCSMAALGHSRSMHPVPVPINVRCYFNSDIIVRRSQVTLTGHEATFSTNASLSRQLGEQRLRLL